MDPGGEDGFTDLGDWLVEDAQGLPPIASGDVIHVLRSDELWAFENSSGEPLGSYSRHAGRAPAQRNHIVASNVSNGSHLRLKDLSPDINEAPIASLLGEVRELAADSPPVVAADPREALLPKFEYYHVFIEAQELEGTGKRSLFGLGPEQMRNVYAWADVNKQLNELGRHGWELLHFEPHWIWGNMAYGAPMWARMLNDSRRKVEAMASYPEYIVGWYCTLRRPARS